MQYCEWGIYMDDSALQPWKENFSLENAIDSINLLEDNKNLQHGDMLVKWKSYQNQIVVESDDFFYKIYERPTRGLGSFNSLLRNCLAKIYSDLGIYWRIISFEKDGQIFDFEQRQKLESSRDAFDNFGELLLSFSKILEKVENELGFSKVAETLRLHSDFKELDKIKLMRLCVNKFDDYAVYHNQAILLDDADFYVVLVGANGEQIKLKKMIDVPVKVCDEDYIFTNLIGSMNERDDIERVLNGVYRATYGWCFLKESNEEDCKASQICITRSEEEKAIIQSDEPMRLLRESRVGNVDHNIEIVETEIKRLLSNSQQHLNSMVVFERAEL